MNSKISELIDKLKQGDISRREFIRTAGLLGMSIGAAEVLAACSAGSKPEALSDAQIQYEGYDTVPTSPFQHITPEATRTSVPTPKQYTWLCQACGARFTKIDELQQHLLNVHARLLPEIKRVDEPTYRQFLKNVKRFDEKNTIFSRIAWDTEYQQRVGGVMPFVTLDDPSFMEGNALVAGAIYVDDTAGSLHPYYPGYFGHIREHGGLYGWEDEVNPSKFTIDDPADMSERVKEVARFYGADLVGITEIDPTWVYENYYEPFTGNEGPEELKYKYAIMMGIEMKWDMIDLSPGPEASAAVALAYSKMAELSASLAKYIRMLGYPAVPSGNDTGQNIPLAIDAGLGELGRLGLMLSPEFGPRQRLCKVLTNMPLVPDKPIDFGIQTYCETCHACAQACPARAIKFDDRTTEPTSKSNRPGILRWPVDVEKCYMFWQENGGIDCANCVAACPWSLSPRRNIFND